MRSGLCEQTELKGWWHGTTCLMEHDGKIFTANENGLGIVCNKKFERRLGLFAPGSPEFVEGMAVHKDNLFLIRAENGETWPDASIICVYSSSSGTLIKQLEGHNDQVTCLRTIGNRLYSGSFDSTIKVWDMDSLELLKTYGDPKNGSFGISALFPFKGDLYSGDTFGTIKKWNLENGEFTVEHGQNGDDIKSLFVDEDRLIFTSDGTIYVKDRKSGTMIHEMEYIRANCVEKFGDLLFVDTKDNASVSIWDLKTGTMLFEHSLKKRPYASWVYVSNSSLRFQEGKLFMPSTEGVVIFDFAAQLDYEKKIKEAEEDSQIQPPPAKKRKLSIEAKENFQVEPPPIMVPFSREISDESSSGDEENASDETASIDEEND